MFTSVPSASPIRWRHESMEVHVVQEKYRVLFTEEEIQKARRWLDEFGIF